MLSEKFFSSRTTVLYAAIVFGVSIIYRISLIGLTMPDVGGVEGNIIYFIQRILDGQPFYTDPEKTPYAIAQYSPSYYYIVATIARLAGAGPDDLLLLTGVNRSVSLFFNLAYITTVFLIARNIYSVSARAAFVTAVLSFIFLEITSFGRPDSSNHFFFLLTLYLFMKVLKKEEAGGSTRLLTSGAAIVAVIALFSKQTSFVLPLIIGWWLLWKKKYNQLLWFSAAYIATAAAFFFMVSQLLGYTLFYKNAVLGINNGIGLGWFRHAVLEPFYLGYGLLFLCLFICVWFLIKKETRPLLHFSGTALVSLFILLNLIAFKNGSNPGYLTEWWTLLILLAAFYWKTICTAASQVSDKLPLVLLWFVLTMKLIGVSKSVLKTASPSLRAAAYTAYAQQKALADTIRSSLGENDKYVVFLNYHTADGYLSNLLFRHAVAPQMDIIGLAAYEGKVYDYSDLDRALTDGRIQWLVTKTTGVQKHFFRILLHKFDYVTTAAGYNLYRFKP